MTTRSLRNYLVTRPAVESATRLARDHEVDTKTATRALRAAGYVLLDSGSWQYNIEHDTKPVDPYNLHIVGISPSLLSIIDSKMQRDEITLGDSKAELLQLLGYVLASLHKIGALPIRGQLTSYGWKSLED